MSLFEMFQPGLKHLREEKDRQKSQVAYPQHGAEGPLGIDLDGGTAKITMPAQGGAAAAANPSSGESEAAGSLQQVDEDPVSTTAERPLPQRDASKPD